MSSSTSSSGRYTGNFSLGGNPAASQPVGAPAPVAPAPPPVQPSAPQPSVPQPNPAPVGDPFQQEHHGNPWKVFGIIVIIAAIGFGIFAFCRWGIPALKGNDSNPNPSSQVGGQTPSGSGDSGNSGEPSQTPSDNGNTAVSVADQAAAIDSWYSGIPESNWLTKTATELGGNNAVALGAFAKHFGVVLADGTVVVRANDENGAKTPTIVSGYPVPPEWRGKGLILDNTQSDLVMVVVQVPTDLEQTFSGDVWQWDASLGTYVYVNSGTSSKRAG